MAGRKSNHDPEFLEAVSKAFSMFLSGGSGRTQEQLAAQLNVSQTTISNWIAKKTSIEGDMLARACIDVGMSFEYKNFVISAAAFGPPALPSVTVAGTPNTQQLTFAFDAMYQNGTSQWKVSHAKFEPLELLLRIKVA